MGDASRGLLRVKLIFGSSVSVQRYAWLGFGLSVTSEIDNDGRIALKVFASFGGSISVRGFAKIPRAVSIKKRRSDRQYVHKTQV